ncbi:MAG: 6-phosphogluconolactonase [Propionibacteriaceae bacterium]|jgi:6-phosphogluconolactonase|nr:6-phosphogluconolactonase [Propionibacteriaceae bacterium]
MTLQRLLRFEDRAQLVDQIAHLLVEALVKQQASTGSVSLCLTGGELANQVYDAMAAISSDLRANEIHLWWNWDYFVATDNPERNSLQTLSRLASTWGLDPAKIHPIPSSSVFSDPEAGAAQYAQDLADNPPIDVCLLELRADGGIAGLLPHHLASPADGLVVGVTDAPGDRVTMTPLGLNTCRQIWIMASGPDVAAELQLANQTDPTRPASFLRGEECTIWLADLDAATTIPFHRCTL